MQINLELMKKHYDEFIPCDCGDCRFFIKNIMNEQPKVCEYLSSIGINPLKPYELMSIYFDKKKEIWYLDCAYIVFGKLDKEISFEIGEVNIFSSLKEKYPLLETDEEYFIISIGKIVMNYKVNTNRHFTFNDKVFVIKNAIDEVDPIGLLKMGSPKNEYIEEAKIIAKSIKRNWVKGKIIQEVFNDQFDEKVSLRKCNEIARNINLTFGLKDYFRDFEENESLKGKVSIEDYEITLKVHDNFVVTNLGGKTYVNGKFYDYIEEQDLLYCFCDFVEKSDVIYVQYKHKHVGFHFSNIFRYFKKIKRSKYSFEKLKNKKDVELVFDNKKLIFGNIDQLNEEKQLFDELDFMIKYYQKTKKKDPNKYTWKCYFWDVHKYVCELEQNSKIITNNKKSISYLKDIMANDGPEYALIIEFYSKSFPKRKYRIGVCVRGEPLIEKIK